MSTNARRMSETQQQNTCEDAYYPVALKDVDDYVSAVDDLAAKAYSITALDIAVTYPTAIPIIEQALIEDDHYVDLSNEDDRQYIDHCLVGWIIERATRTTMFTGCPTPLAAFINPLATITTAGSLALLDLQVRIADYVTFGLADADILHAVVAFTEACTRYEDALAQSCSVYPDDDY